MPESRIDLFDCSIRITSSSTEIHDAVDFYFAVSGSDGSGPGAELCFDYHVGPRPEPVEGSRSVFHALGFGWDIDSSGRSATVYQTDPAAPRNATYHHGLLHPLHSLLSPTGSVLIHAALVARSGRGILMPGRGGAGKSTLCLRLLSRGFQYFTEEHALLRTAGGGVDGVAFPNRIGIRDGSAHLFPELARQWERDVLTGKRFFLPLDAIPLRADARCRIDTVLFPRFTAGADFAIEPVAARDALLRFVRDDYFLLGYQFVRDKVGSARHFDLLATLATSTAAYEVTFSAKDEHRVVDAVVALVDG